MTLPGLRQTCMVGGSLRGHIQDPSYDSQDGRVEVGSPRSTPGAAQKPLRFDSPGAIFEPGGGAKHSRSGRGSVGETTRRCDTAIEGYHR